MFFRLFLFLFLACSFAMVSQAQIGEQRRALSLGVNLGVAMNTVDFDPTIKQKSHLGPSLGVSLRYVSEKYFTTYCAVYAELNYAVLGWKEDIYNGKGERLPDSYSRNIHYLQLPVFARLSWGKEMDGAQFFFQAGPQFGLCLGENSSRSSSWTLDSEGNPWRPNNVYKQYDKGVERRFDYGIAAGLGLEYSNYLGHFIAEGRYYYGLGDMFGNSKKDPFARSANGTIYIKLAYLFDR